MNMKYAVNNLLAQLRHQISTHMPQSLRRCQNPDISEREWAIYRSVKRPGLTMLSLERVLANIHAADYVVSRQIPGDIVECGVWRGGSSMAMAAALVSQRDTSRTLWLYDTYAGMTEATDVDKTYSGASAAALMAEAMRREAPEHSLLLAYASLEDVQRNMQGTGYPMERIRFVKGAVEQTIPGQAPEQIAVLRIDTDWYESTRHELMHLYPRLSPGGILIIDDYGHWQGARKAVDDYFKDAPLFLSRIDSSGRVAVKPPGHIVCTPYISNAETVASKL
jgi:O-methyltransferase